jgi:hypothetical protein
MNLKFPLFALVAMLASACSNTATGQKERAIALTSTNDSVSYSIGTDIGRNIHTQMKQSGLDSLNYDAMFAGMRDAIDSTDRISEDRAKDMVQTYMMAAQQKVMAKKQAEGEAQKAEGEKFLAENSKKPGVITTASGLQYEVVNDGQRPQARTKRYRPCKLRRQTAQRQCVRQLLQERRAHRLSCGQVRTRLGGSAAANAYRLQVQALRAQRAGIRCPRSRRGHPAEQHACVRSGTPRHSAQREALIRLLFNLPKARIFPGFCFFRMLLEPTWTNSFHLH